MKMVPLNLNEAALVLNALRQYISSDSFTNDPELVAKTGVLLTKIANAANSNLK